MMSDRSIRLLVFLATCVSRAFVFGEQQFLETPQPYQEVSPGDDVRLRCIVQDKGGDCGWLKDRRLLRMNSGKYEWANDRDRGDCTLLIKRADLNFDDGIWECLITSSNFTRQDALTSEESRLVVKVPPKKPQLQNIVTRAILGANLTLKEEQNVNISCVSKYGNPPALIKWFIGNKEIKSVEPQRNTTEVDNPKTWEAYSLLEVRGQRENHGLQIRCVTMHPTSSVPISAETRLDVHYSPEVRLEQPLTTLEDSVSFLNLTCLADANPAPSIKWEKYSVPLSTSLIDAASSPSLTQDITMQLNETFWAAELRFDPVTRRDAGLYSCKATNDVGESALNYRLDVQYAPQLKSIDGNNTLPNVVKTALLGPTVDPFECPEYDANPPAQYRWVHIRGNLTETIKNHMQNNGSGRRLHLDNTMWSDEGEYRCIAFNTVNDVRRETECKRRYVLHVTGRPEIELPGGRDYESVGWTGEPVHTLKSRFCSRPTPKLVAWQWGSCHIRAGQNIHSKYEALQLDSIFENNVPTNCYWAKLEIKDLQKEDARMYTLLVENEMGRDSTNIKLIVRDPTKMRAIAATVAVGLLLLVLVSVSVYSLLKMRRGRYRQKVEEEGSIAADALNGNGASLNEQKSVNCNSSHAKTFAGKSSLNGTQSSAV